jgi:F0F1-type ATP synthase epsilon subunit
MELTIITPTHKQTVNVAWLEFNTPCGNLVILPGHMPTIVTLAEGQKMIYALANGVKESMSITRGIAHITRNAVMVVVNE